MAIKLYTKQFARMLPDLFESKAKFYRAFGGNLQTIIGAEADANYLSIKVSDTNVVIQDYSTGAAVAFGEGTADSNRFGPRKEIITEDETVAYDTPLAIHEGIDSFTVNDIPNQVVAERLALHGVAWAEKYDKVLSAYIVTKKGKLYDDVVKSGEGLTKLFSDAYQWFINKGVSQSIRWVAYVTPEVYDILVNEGLTTILKGADVDIGAQFLYAFKGFILEPVPTAKFVDDYIAYFLPDNVGVAGVAIPVARTLDSEAFAGVAIQAAGKLGKYIPTKNKDAIIVAKFADPQPAPDTGNIRFVAKDSGGSGVKDVKITIGEDENLTNEYGIALFEDLAVGEITWAASKDNCDITTATGTKTVVKDETVVVNIEANDHKGTAKFTLAQPIQNAKITIEGVGEELTNASGVAEFTLLVGDHVWSIALDGCIFHPATDTVTIEKEQETEVAISVEPDRE